MQDGSLPLSSAAAPTLVRLGVMEYRRCLALQNELHARVLSASGRESFILFVQHPPVLTLGKHADAKHLKLSEAHYANLGIDLVAIDRGGEVTAHEPGQLVMYPILRLADFKLTPKSYVCLLEDAVIATVRAYGGAAGRDPAHPGVWVEDRKICAIGVRIRDRATLHGIALNVENSLELFDKIVPCGISNRGVTSLARELRRSVSVAEVEALLARETLLRLAQRAAPENRIFPSLQWANRDLIISP